MSSNQINLLWAATITSSIGMFSTNATFRKISTIVTVAILIGTTIYLSKSVKKV